MNEKVRLLNVDVDNVTMGELVKSFDQGMLMTLHSEMLMKLQEDREFYEVLPQFDVITCDSQILYAASKFLGHPLKGRVSGSDFFPHYYNRHKNNPKITIFICGGRPGIAEIAQKKINENIGRKIVVGTDSPPFDFDQKPDACARMVDRINQSGASVLLVGLGAGRQEKFIVKYRGQMENVHTFLPLGGTIDYEAGVLPRPQQWMTNVGGEWLYRLFKEPQKRWRRYLIHDPPVLWYLMLQKFGLYKNPF